MSLDSCDCVFHGIGYNLTITVSHGGNSSSSPSSLSQFQESSYTSSSSSSSSSSSTLTPEPTLFVDLEELSSSATWHGEFSASYVENITRKTGSFKRFDVLVKMLVGALQARTETVFLDLLTYADLEALRVRKAGGGSATASATASGTTPARTAATTTTTTSSSSLTINTKRYLILTYVAEFDRIHYPLPLLFEETPTVASLSRLVRRLRGEVLSFRSLAGLAAQAPALTAGGLPTSNVDALSSSVQGLQRENALLRQMLTEQQAKVNEEKESVSAMKGQITSLSDMNKTAEAAIEKLRNASKAEVKRLRGEIAELQAKVVSIGGGGGSATGVTNTPSFADVDHVLSQQQQSSSSSPLLDTDNNVIIQLRESNDALSKRVQELTKQLALSKGTSGSTMSTVQRGRALLATNAKGVRGGSAHNVSSSKSPAATARSPATISTASIARLALNKTVAAASSQPQRGRSSSVGSTGSVKRSNSASSATKALSSSRRTPTPVRNNTLNNSHTSVGSAGRTHSLAKSRHTVTTSSTSSSNGGVGEGISNNNITSANTTPTSISSTGGPRPGSRAYYNAKVAAARAAAAATSSSPSLRSKSGTVTPTPPTLVSGGASLESSLSVLNNKALATSITSASPFGGRSANGGGVLTSKVASAQSAHSNGGGRSTSRGSTAGRGGGGKAAASLSQSPYLTSIGPMLQTLERGPAGRKSATPTPTRDFSSSISASSSLVNGGGGSGRVTTSAPSLTSSSSGSRSTSTGKAQQQATRSSTTEGQNNENVNQNETLSGYSTVGEKQHHHQQHQEQQKPSVLSSSSSLNNNIADPPVIPRQAWTSASAVETTSAPPPPPSVMGTSKASTSSSTSPGSNTNRYEASTEIQDIDARLAQLQDFLRAAKNGDPLPTL